MNRLYFYLTNDLCTLNPDTGMWRIELPRDFIDSRRPAKAISVMNFKYVAKHACENHLNTSVPIDETSFHSPTLSDGNFNQDHFVTTANYQFNTVYKTYKIRTNPQFFEFYFRDSRGNIIKKFYYTGEESGLVDANGLKCPMIESFRVELELIY